MRRKRFIPEQIIAKLHKTELGLSQGITEGQICQQQGIAKQTYYRWRKAYGGLKVSQAKRMKALELALRVKGMFAPAKVEHSGGIVVADPEKIHKPVTSGT